MKLFIWNNPYPVEFGGSIIYAVAETEEEAREVALKAPVAMYGAYVTDKGDGIPWFKLGEPDRVFDVPCAEIYHWSE